MRPSGAGVAPTRSGRRPPAGRSPPRHRDPRAAVPGTDHPRGDDVGLEVDAARRQPGSQRCRELLEGPRRPAAVGLGLVHAEVHRGHHRDPDADRAGARAAGAGGEALEQHPAHRDPGALSARHRLGFGVVLRALLTPGRPHQQVPRRPRRHGAEQLAARHAGRCALGDGLPRGVALLGLLHAAHDGGAAGHPTDVYEAARIDGASRWRTFTQVTLPLLKPTIAMTMIMSITGSLLAFDQFYVLTKGGPNNSTMTVVQLIYRYAFETKRDLGMAAALSVLVLVALIVINAIQLRAMGVSDKEDR
nr:sugar ABC transporter permease [Tessaracoccus coleopterorum]